MEISNDTGALSSDIRTIRSGLEQARSHLRQLDASMESLNSMWSGPANQTMRQRFQSDRESITKLCVMLEMMVENLTTSRKSYDNCESNVSGIVSGIHIG